MVFFYLISCLLLLIAALALLRPFKSKRENNQSRTEINTTYFNHRLDEIERDEQLGLVAEKSALVAELQQTLLDDAKKSAQPMTTRSGSTPYLLGAVVMVSVAIASYLYTGNYQDVKEHDALVTSFPALQSKLNEQGIFALSNIEIATIAVGLRNQVDSEPTNIDNWVALGRIGSFMGDLDTAVLAFENALAIAPDDRGLLLGFAELLVKSKAEDDHYKANELLVSFLQEDPNNIQALKLLAESYSELKDFNQSYNVWVYILQQMPKDDPRRGEMQYLFTLSIYNNALHQVEQKNYQYAVDLWKYLLSILPQSDSRRSQIERFINENEKRIMLQ